VGRGRAHFYLGGKGRRRKKLKRGPVNRKRVWDWSVTVALCRGNEIEGVEKKENRRETTPHMGRTQTKTSG